MSSKKQKHDISFALLRKNLEQIRNKNILQQKHKNHNNRNRT